MYNKFEQNKAFSIVKKALNYLKPKYFAVCILLSLTFATVQSVYSAVGIRETINFQGKLVNSAGLNVADGSYSVVFSLYTVSSGGTNLWQETQNVSTVDGLFRVELGSVSSLSSVNFNNDSLYLGIKVGADAEMTPRVRYTATPYAFQAKNVSWSGLQSPNANTSLSMAAYTTSLLYSGTSGSNDLFVLSSSANSTGTGRLMSLRTATDSEISPFHVSAKGIEALFVSNLGRVGIGTTSPSAQLEILKTTNGITNELLRLSNSGVGTGTGGALTFANLDAVAGQIKTVYGADANWSMGLGTVGYLDTVTLKNGNVGIGTTAPTSALSVNGLIDIPGSNNPTLSKHFTGSQVFNYTADAQIRKVIQFANTDANIKSGVIFGTVTLTFAGMETGNANPVYFVRRYNVRVRDWYAGGSYPMTAYLESIYEEGGQNKITLDVDGTPTSTALALKAKVYQNNGAFEPGSQLTISFDFTSSAVLAGNFITPSFANGSITSGDPGTQGAVILAGSGGNVGIGTTSPTLRLEISAPFGAPVTSGTTPNGNFALTSPDVYSSLYMGIHSNQAASNYSPWIQAADRNSLGTYRSLLLNPNGGNVGIGTASPVGKLHIGATTGVVSPGSIALSIRDASSPTYGFDFNLEGVSTGDLSLMRTVLGTQSQVMTFQRSSGNVGIGTTAPTSALSVNGLIDIPGSNNPTLSKHFTGSQVFNYTADAQIRKVIQFANTDANIKSGVIFGTVTLTFAGMETGNANPVYFVRRYNVRVRDWYAGGSYPMTAYLESIYEEGGQNKITLDVDGTPTSTALALKAKVYQNNGAFEPGSQLTISFDFTSSAVLAGNFITPSFANGSITSGDPGTQGAVILAGSGGNVGIGTTSPTLRLEISAPFGAPVTSGTTPNGNFALTSPDVYSSLYMGIHSNQAASNYSPWIQAADRNSLGTYRSLLLNPNGGNVGIGTLNPNATLEVGSNRPTLINGSSGMIFTKGDASGWAFGYHAIGFSGTDLGGFGFLGGSNLLTYLYAGDSYASPIMVWEKATKNVGIGTVSPTTLLHLQSATPTLTIKGTGSGEFGLKIIDGGSASTAGLTYNSITGEQRLNGAQSYVYQTFYAGGSEWMRITSGGNVGIGITNPTSKLYVYNSTAATHAYVTIQNSLSTHQAALQLATLTVNANWTMYIPGSSSDLRLFNGSDRVVFLANGTTQLNGTLTMSNQAINGVYSIQQHTSSRWKFDQNGDGYLSGTLSVGQGMVVAGTGHSLFVRDNNGGSSVQLSRTGIGATEVVLIGSDLINAYWFGIIQDSTGLTASITSQNGVAYFETGVSAGREYTVDVNQKIYIYVKTNGSFAAKRTVGNRTYSVSLFVIWR